MNVVVVWILYPVITTNCLIMNWIIPEEIQIGIKIKN